MTPADYFLTLVAISSLTVIYYLAIERANRK
jgi:hypothetical protein